MTSRGYSGTEAVFENATMVSRLSRNVGGANKGHGHGKMQARRGGSVSFAPSQPQPALPRCHQLRSQIRLRVSRPQRCQLRTIHFWEILNVFPASFASC
jgi:hypothetical protein